jgi:hypothetical protein
VLMTLDFTTFTFDVLCVELLGLDSKRENAVEDLLVSKGYEFYSRVIRNVWYTRKGFIPSRDPTANITDASFFLS